MSSRAANAYRRVDLESAPKEQILERLFERFLVDIDRARSALATQNVAAKSAALDHAVQIAGELQASLDHAVAPELCENLSALYDFVIYQLMQVNLSMQPADLAPVERIMRELGTAFAGARR